MTSQKITNIGIHGVPRSGTSWLGEIFNSSPHTIYKYQPFYSYALRDFLTPSSTLKDINEFFSILKNLNDNYLDQTEKRNQGILPTFSKIELTHLVYKDVRFHHILKNIIRKKDDFILISIIRNPLSVINSWLQAPKDFRLDLGWQPLEEWRYAVKMNIARDGEFNGYEKWKEATYNFLFLKKMYPQRVYIVRYKNLLETTLQEVENIFTFSGLKMNEQTVSFLKESSSKYIKNAYSIYRTQQRDDKWKKSLDFKIIDEIQRDLNGTELERFLET